MMKKFIKLVALLLAIVMAAFIGACGGPDEPNLNGKNENGELEGKLQIIAPDLGFGTEWLEKLKTGFETKYPAVTVSIKTSSLLDKVNVYLTSSKANPYDLIFSETSQVFRYAEKENTVAGYTHCYENLQDVYDTIPEGQTKSIKEIMYDGVYDYFKTDDSTVYAMPYSVSMFGLMYNTNLVAESELPKTTDELTALAKKIEETKSVRGAFVWTKDSDYFEQIFETLWAQYEGLENWKTYFKSTDINVLKQTGRVRALEAISKWIDNKNGYADPDSPGLEYIPAQTRLMRGEAAFYPCGSWIENEMDEFFDSGSAPISFMKTPVISSIVEKLEYRDNGNYMSDALLSQIVAAIDEGATSYDGVSEADFAHIYQARTMYYYENFIDTVVIPAFSDAKELAKAFLVYMYSDEGIKAQTSANSGGSLPVYYNYTEEMTSGFSAMQKFRLGVMGNTKNYVFRPRHGSIMSTDFHSTIISSALGGVSGTKTPAQIVQDTYDYYNANSQQQWRLLTEAK